MKRGEKSHPRTNTCARISNIIRIIIIVFYLFKTLRGIIEAIFVNTHIKEKIETYKARAEINEIDENKCRKPMKPKVVSLRRSLH